MGSNAAYLNFTSLLLNYREMATHFNGTSNGNTYDMASDYHVLYVSLTTIKVNISLTSGGSLVQYTAHVWKNGTAQSVSVFGYNYTGSSATGQFDAAMSPYLILQLFSSPDLLSQFTSSQFVHVTGHSTVMLGPSSVAETKYSPNNIPLNIATCNGSSTLSRFDFQTGIVSGKSQVLVTSMAINGSVASSQGTNSYNVSFDITSITV